MTTKSNIEVSTGQKIATIAPIVFFAVIGGAFGFLLSTMFDLGGNNTSTTRLIAVLTAATIFSLIPIIAMSRGIKKGRKKVQESGGDPAHVDPFTLMVIGNYSQGGFFGESNGNYVGGDSGGFSGGDSGSF